MPGIREIKIIPCLNGFVCHIGCQMAVFNDAETMAAKLVEYCNNPDEVEKEWLDNTNRYSGAVVTENTGLRIDTNQPQEGWVTCSYRTTKR